MRKHCLAQMEDKRKQKNMSMRQLAAETGIHVSTISRILSGKRQPTLAHLRSISLVLHIPLNKLLDEGAKHQDEVFMDQVQELIQSMQLPIQRFTMKNLKEKLIEYQQISKTYVGNQKIVEPMTSKLSELKGQGPFIEQLKVLYKTFLDNNRPKKDLLLVGSALIYFITVADLIPDYLFPMGYLDDALVIQYVMQTLSLRN